MTKREAGKVIARARAVRGVGKRQHFFDRLDEYGLDVIDAYRILDVGEMSRPRWDALHENWTVRFVGKTLGGGAVAVVLSIEQERDRVYFVTIEDLE